MDTNSNLAAFYRGRRVLVTGGAGFIGGHLVRGLLARGATVRVLDNLANGTRDNLAQVMGDVELIEGDIRELAACLKAAAACDVVFHLAALGSVPRSVEDPLTYHAVNVDGTLNVLQAAREAGVRRVVYSASSSAYGDSPALPKVETQRPMPKSPYAVGKLVGEYYAAVYAGVYGVSTICLRYFNVFGPRQNPNSQYAAVIPAFISALLAGKGPTIYGDGGQTRDFCYVDNVVLANLLGGASEKELCGEVVNVACGERVSLNEMLAEIQRLLGTNLRPTYLRERAGDVRDSLADIGAIRELLGYEAVVRFKEGLARAVEWYRAHTK